LPNIESVRKVADPVPDERVMGDLDALGGYAKRHPAGRAERIGVKGFCRRALLFDQASVHFENGQGKEDETEK
jgi:dienelactone hydrolase